MNDYLASFCDTLTFPPEATAELLNAYRRLSAHPQGARFADTVSLYEQDHLTDHRQALADMDAVAEATGIHRYTVHLLLYLCFSRHTRELYRRQGVAESIYLDSMADMLWKLRECHALYGVWGSHVAFWFDRFFDLTRFALGRLQFETVAFQREYAGQGVALHPGDTVINVHIPSSGPLTAESCADAYARAAAFYRPRLGEGALVFVCHSWLLNPHHSDFLPPESNIRRFAGEYEIVYADPDPAFPDCWRVFNRDYDGNPDSLPAATSLQAAYKRWLLQGGVPSMGYGVYVYAPA